MSKSLPASINNRRRRVLASCLFTLITLVLLLTPHSARTQSRPDAKEILKRVSETYRSAQSYHVEGILFIEIDTTDNYLRLDLPVLMDGARPARSRLEIKHRSFGYLSVSDGVTDWAYLPAKNQYTSKPTSSNANSRAALTAEYEREIKRKTLDLNIGTASGNMISNYENLGQGVKSARILREEPVTANGLRADCYVVELEWQSAPETFGVRISPRTLLWIDKTRNLVLRDSMTNRLQAGGKAVALTYDFHYNLIKLNEAVSPSLFLFTPPPGAQRVEKLEEREDE